MFLGPQHLQAAQRYEASQRRKGDRWGVRYNWGLRSLELNHEALANHRLEVHSVQACLPDGALVDLPEDGPLPTLDFREALEGERTLRVFLALPSFRLGSANAPDDGSAEGARYLQETQELEDENTGLYPQPIRVRLLNVKFLLSTQREHTGYDTLPIAQIEKSPEADTAPRLDVSYIPPLVACDAWPPLQIGILRYLYDRIGIKVDLLAGQVLSRGIGVESHSGEDTRIIGQLRALNEAYALLNILAFAEGVHPFQAYLELCRLVGQLAIFSERHRPPDLPRYDHDDLGRCFYQVKVHLDDLLNLIVEPDWQQRPFWGEGKHMEVPILFDWLAPAWQMFVGVKSPLPSEQCIGLFTTPGVLDMKIGSSKRVDSLFEHGVAGLKFTHRPPPRVLPTTAGLIYFQVDRTAQAAEWQHVQADLKLAIRVNEKRVVGSIQGQDTLTIKHGNQTIPLRFTLYVTRSAPATS
jgi:type VI secretion system protein ImpJ